MEEKNIVNNQELEKEEVKEEVDENIKNEESSISKDITVISNENNSEVSESIIKDDSNKHEKKHLKASRSKMFTTALMDFLAHAMLFVLIFGAVTVSIITASGLNKGFNDARDTYFTHIKETRLIEFDDKNIPLDANKSAINYIGSMIKTTYYYEKEPFKMIVDNHEKEVTLTEKDTLGYKENGNYVNDNIAYYYFEYRESDKCDLSSEIKSNYGTFKNKYSFLYNGAFKLNAKELKGYFNPTIFEDEAGNINSEIENKSILNLETAKLLQPYFFLNSRDEKADNVARILAAMYGNALQQAVNELSEHSPRYIQLFNEVENQRKNLFRIQVASLFITYIVTFGVYFLALPLLFKGKTIGMKFSRVFYSKLDASKPQIKDFTIKFSTMFFTEMLSVGAPILLIYGATLDVLDIPLFGVVTFKHILIVLSVITGISLLIGMFTKDNRFLGDQLSKICYRDEDLLDIEPNEDAKYTLEKTKFLEK